MSNQVSRFWTRVAQQTSDTRQGTIASRVDRRTYMVALSNSGDEIRAQVENPLDQYRVGQAVTLILPSASRTVKGAQALIVGAGTAERRNRT